jgi:hypothetical protein
MFWGRTAAIRPLLDIDIGFADFPPESGQVDGTLAHAIERSLLMIAESRGFEWLKVAQRDLYPMGHTLLPVHSVDDLAEHRLGLPTRARMRRLQFSSLCNPDRRNAASALLSVAQRSAAPDAADPDGQSAADLRRDRHRDEALLGVARRTRR